MDNILKFEFIPEKFKSTKSKFRDELKQELIKNDKLLVSWTDEFSEYEPSPLVGIVAMPMSCFEDDADYFIKKNGISWFCERTYTGEFSPYDDYYLLEPVCGDILSFSKSEYLDWLRRPEHFNKIIEVIENYTYKCVL